MGAVITRNMDMLNSLFNDTEEHLRQHRDSLSPRVENQAVLVHTKTEVNVNASSSSSSEEFREERVQADVSKREKNASCKKSKENYSKFHGNVNNSQSLTQQDQCCPGFSMSKSGKTRHQNNGCIVV